MSLEITAARPDPALLDLPWATPLEEWPDELLAAFPRGISRHVVRFVKLSGRVLAIKEIKTDIARREYEMLRNLRRLDLPSVFVYNGSIMPGNHNGVALDITSVFEAIGACAAGKISEEELTEVERKA